MATFALARYALSMGAAATLLAGCGGSGPNFPAPVVEAARSRTSSFVKATGSRPHAVEKVLHSFGYGTDGYVPRANLIDVKGTLYGETYSGGGYAQGGTVFSISLSGSEQVLHTFGYGSDGANPRGGLIDMGGMLYGTTPDGGLRICAPFGCGTVFSISTGGTERVLHPFAPAPDGNSPIAGLLAVKGTLYGTTLSGGAYHYGPGYGTVFRMSTAGAEKVLHRFAPAGGRDGSDVYAGLTHIKNTLYGTTYLGGSFGDGTVFSISTSGTKYKVLHNFSAGSDGAYPVAGLTVVNGTLYGTTTTGGLYAHCSVYYYSGCGTVFSITPAGTEKVLHSFGNGSDGQAPYAGLIDVNGTLYGTTANGGSGYCNNYGSGYSGCGTVFRINQSGKEKVIYSFSGPPSDGQWPGASLIDVNGTLYGTTPHGGAYDSGSCEYQLYGCGGTVFSLTP